MFLTPVWSMRTRTPTIDSSNRTLKLFVEYGKNAYYPQINTYQLDSPLHLHRHDIVILIKELTEPSKCFSVTCSSNN
jgi:hypothetical protein